MSLGYPVYIELLLQAAKENNEDAVHTAFMMIALMDGDHGMRRALERLLDEATVAVPRVEAHARYDLSAFVFDMTNDREVPAQEAPYEFQWVLKMLSARLNRDSDTLTDLIKTATDDLRLPACAMLLAYFASRPDNFHMVVV